MASPYDKLRALLPNRGKLLDRWELIGDVLVIDTNDVEVASAYAEVLGARSVIRQISINGEMRRVKSEFLWGDPNTETIYKENRLLYKLDPSKIMLSSGNKNERIRMSQVASQDEVCLDMFAGIGYFALPLALHSKKVFAIEKNPLAFRYLLENIGLNGFDNMVPILGDCGDVLIPQKVDRVVMGYLNSRPFLEKALSSISDQAVIHYHVLHRTGDMVTPIKELEEKSSEHGFTFYPLFEKEVKSYSPGMSHIVVDGLFRREIR